MKDTTKKLLAFMRDRHPLGISRVTCVPSGVSMHNLRALERYGYVQESSEAEGIWYLTDKALQQTEPDSE